MKYSTDGGTATCTEKAVCESCGEEYGEIDVSNHTNLVKTEAKQATYMAVGNIENRYCDGSGWRSNETGHWNTCECGGKLNETAHTFEWVIDKEATRLQA